MEFPLLRLNRVGLRIAATMLTAARVGDLLKPFQLRLSDEQTAQVLAYLELLLRWNQKINLTAIRDPEECVQRHFGESLYLARHVDVSGRLLDVGSGAGFPGLALKIAFPAIAVTLLEPVAKKRAFLKEVLRTCGMEPVEVRGERLEEFASQITVPEFDAATSRAVGHFRKLLPLTLRCLKPRGRIFLWLAHRQGTELRGIAPEVSWAEPIPIPLGREGEIWWGTKAG